MNSLASFLKKSLLKLLFIYFLLLGFEVILFLIYLGVFLISSLII